MPVCSWCDVQDFTNPGNVVVLAAPSSLQTLNKMMCAQGVGLDHLIFLLRHMLVRP